MQHQATERTQTDRRSGFLLTSPSRLGNCRLQQGTNGQMYSLYQITSELNTAATYVLSQMTRFSKTTGKPAIPTGTLENI